MNRDMKCLPCVVVLGCALLMFGCSEADCSDPELAGTAACKPAEQLSEFRHPDKITMSAPYVKGQHVDIVSDLGKVTVFVGQQLGSVDVTFERFAPVEGNDQASANAAMDNGFDFNVALGGSSTVEVFSRRREMAAEGVGSDLIVSLPIDFVGGFTLKNFNGSSYVDIRQVGAMWSNVLNENGDLELQGTGGQLSVTVNNGNSLKASLRTWPPETSSLTGNVSELVFALPPGANGFIKATSSAGSVNEPNPLPSDWLLTGSPTAGAKDFTLGPEVKKGGVISVINSGDILLKVGDI